eukprot:gene31580-biopygen104407
MLRRTAAQFAVGAAKGGVSAAVVSSPLNPIGNMFPCKRTPCVVLFAGVCSRVVHAPSRVLHAPTRVLHAPTRVLHAPFGSAVRRTPPTLVAHIIHADDPRSAETRVFRGAACRVGEQSARSPAGGWRARRELVASTHGVRLRVSSPPLPPCAAGDDQTITQKELGTKWNDPRHGARTLDGRYVMTKLSHFRDFCIATSLWPLTFGLACCAVEMIHTMCSRA